jgi:hypothetical protein
MLTLKNHTARRIFFYGVMILSMLAANLGEARTVKADSALNVQAGSNAIVFVSRQIPPNGSAYYNQAGSMPGVQPWSRFQVSAPGKLIIREANGTLRTLIDGSNPTAASLNLIDVNAPDVSYNATKIVFAGLPSGSYSTSPMTSPGAWRIYMINVDGTGLRQITFSDRNINLSQFGTVASNFTRYDDTDPVWLPDGRIVFSSTRWPSLGQYGAALTSNLHVINADGSNLHRITAERNGAERPLIDPLTGKIVYSRWWRNFRLGTDSMANQTAPEGGYIIKDGICALSRQGAECQEAGGLTALERNAWHLATINPDGTGLAQFAGRSNTFVVGELINHAYGGSFAANGDLYANFFPMTNGTEAAGFGGIRLYKRGANGYTPIIGITTRDEDTQQFVRTNPNSYGVYVGNYAGEPEVMPNGQLIISWAQDARQDYGLYMINANGGNRTLLYDNPGTTELRARLVRVRPVPTIIPDKVTRVASLLPPSAQGPYDIDGTFTFNALNVYFNAPVDVDIMSAPPVGSANSIRFFIDHQRNQQRGSFETLDWPILLQEVVINPNGSVAANAPANVPLFEQLRTNQPGYDIPLTGRAYSPNEVSGAAHVAGMNYGRTGDVSNCVGCHAGHTMIPVPSAADALWTNLAPGAAVTYSSLSSSLNNGDGLVDRRVNLLRDYDNHKRFWQSRDGQNPNQQWVQLAFPVPITIRTVRLYNIPASESSIQVQQATVRLYSDAAGAVEVASIQSGPLSSSGTDVTFPEVFARVVRIEFNSVSGSAAGLAEVEVIARAEASGAVPGATATARPAVTPTLTSTATATSVGSTTPLPTTTAVSSPTSTLVSSSTLTATPISSATVVVPSPTIAFTATNTPLPTWTATNTNTPTAVPSNTPAPTFTALPTNTATSNPTSVPPAGVLDTFNRVNGRIGKNWSAETSRYRVASNQLDVRGVGAIFWKANSFGKDQEVFVTLAKVDPFGREINLLLKAQNPSNWGDGVIEVSYSAVDDRVQILTYTFAQDWVQCGANIPVTFVHGDRFGAKAKADGMVEVYRNGALIGSCNVGSWPFATGGGYIGLWFLDASDSVADNFGGGTITP